MNSSYASLLYFTALGLIVLALVEAEKMRAFR